MMEFWFWEICAFVWRNSDYVGLFTIFDRLPYIVGGQRVSRV